MKSNRSEVKNNTTKYKIIRSLLVCIALILFTRCDFVFKDDINYADKSQANAINIQKNKDEARFLVSATQHNLDVVELIEVIKEAELDPEAQFIVEKLENQQRILHNYYDRVAKKHVISIPNYSTINKKAYLKSEEVMVLDVLSQISTKLNKQIKVIDNLATRTQNHDFKNLAEVANQKLFVSLDETKVLENEILNQ